MKCETVLEKLDAFRTGELGSSAARAVQRHAVSCRRCSTALEELRMLATRSAALRVKAPGSILTAVLAETGDHFDRLETAVGPVWVGFSTRGISMVYPGTIDAAQFERTYRARRGRPVSPLDVPERYAAWVCHAAAGTLAGTPKLDLEGLPEFERRVLTLLRKIPRGEVRPYAWVAREAGRPAAVRAVGNSMARNPLPLLLPCHRVVPTRGGVGGYAFGSEMKQGLLRREGAPVDDLDALARDGVRFVGCTSTHVFCLPSCRQLRRSRPDRRRSFADAAAAFDSGFRPCRHCRPEPATA